MEMTNHQFKLLMKYIDKVVEFNEHSSHDGFVELEKLKEKLRKGLVKEETK